MDLQRYLPVMIYTLCQYHTGCGCIYHFFRAHLCMLSDTRKRIQNIRVLISNQFLVNILELCAMVTTNSRQVQHSVQEVLLYIFNIYELSFRAASSKLVIDKTCLVMSIHWEAKIRDIGSSEYIQL